MLHPTRIVMPNVLSSPYHTNRHHSSRKTPLFADNQKISESDIETEFRQIMSDTDKRYGYDYFDPKPH